MTTSTRFQLALFAPVFWLCGIALLIGLGCG